MRLLMSTTITVISPQSGISALIFSPTAIATPIALAWPPYTTSHHVIAAPDTAICATRTQK